MAFTLVPVNYAAPGPIKAGDTVHFKHDQEVKAPVYAVEGDTIFVTHGGRLVAVDRSSIYHID